MALNDQDGIIDNPKLKLPKAAKSSADWTWPLPQKAPE